MRKEVASKAVNPSHFRVIEYRSRFTKLTHGVAFDSFRSEAMPGPPSEFCVLFNLGKSATFSLALYGDEASLGLANGWACRLQQFFDVWVARDRSLAFAFDSPHVDGLK